MPSRELITIVTVHLFTVDKKRFTRKLSPKLIKVSQKRGKITHLYKSENIHFFITFKILSKFEEPSCRKVKYNLFSEYMFCITLKDYYLEPKLLFLP